MAIAPNTNPFVAGSILTAAQMTALPMGIYSFVEKTTTTTPVTTEQVILTLPSFTAVANRYYKVTFFLPYLETISGLAGDFTVRIRKGTTTAGTILNLTFATSSDTSTTVTWVGTLTAGAQQMVGTVTATTASNILGAATAPAQMTIEDIGGA